MRKTHNFPIRNLITSAILLAAITIGWGGPPDPTFPVKWRLLYGVSNSNGVLTPIVPGDGNTMGLSSNVLPANQDGWIQFTAAAGSNYLIGFSSNEITYNASVQYGLYVQPGFALDFGESSWSPMGTANSWQVGDVLKIARTGSTIIYSKNGASLRSVSTDPNQELSVKVNAPSPTPLITASFDSRLFPVAAVSGTNASGLGGSITVTTTGGTSPYTYLWSSGETTGAISGKATGTYSVTVTDAGGRSINRSYSLAYQGLWRMLNGVSESNGNLTSTVGPGGNNFAMSSNVLPANQDGWIEFVPQSGASDFTMGFATNEAFYAASLQYAFYLSSQGSTQRLYIIENSWGGIDTGNPWQIGDVLKIARIGTAIKYYRNGTVLRTVSTNSGQELTIKSVISSGSATPKISSSVDCRLFPVPTITGTNGQGQNGSISVLTVGGTAPYTYHWSSGENLNIISTKASGNYTVTVTDAAGRTVAKTYSLAALTSWLSLFHTVDNAGKLGTTSGASWDGSGMSYNGLAANQDGWIEFVVDPGTQDYLIGFSDNGSTSAPTSVAYGFYPWSSQYVRQMYIMESSWGGVVSDIPVQLGDVLKISRVGSFMNYFRNGNLLRTVATDPTRQLSVRALVNSGTAPTVQTSQLSLLGERKTMINNWAFQYRYDARRRLIAERAPGSDWVYKVYDQLNRLVMTQDGNQRQINQWTYVKYDALNRGVMTGLYTHNSLIDQQGMTDLISTSVFAEVYNGIPATHGYTNTVFPTTSTTLLTATYYDDYQFVSPLINGGNPTVLTYNYKPDDLAGQEATSIGFIRNHITGTKVNIVGTSTYLWNVTYFDSRYQPIQTISDNGKGGIDRLTRIMDFAGRTTKVKTSHSVVLAGVTVNHTTARRLIYDHADRLLKTWHSVDGGAEILLIQNDYNELGRLVDKRLFSDDNGTTFKQSVDRRYNIRGWLTSINNSTLSDDNGSTNDDNGDLFGMNLGYNNDLGTGNTPKYNGNISAMKWSTNMGLDAIKELAYNYEYDPMNRLLSAVYKQKSASWSASGGYNELGFGYDDNGNVQSLQRLDKTGAVMDNLSYDYGGGQARGNRLMGIADAGNVTNGFVDGHAGAGDYAYDSKGNMTSDLNKGVVSVSYNFLGLPTQVTKTTGDYIRYIYKASGEKISQQVFNAANVLKKDTDYDAQFFYENDTLKYISHEEGRILMTSAIPEYQYDLKDHLGNARMSFTTVPKTDSPMATFETANMAQEQSQFLRYASAKRVYCAIFDRTNGTGSTPGYSQRLSGSTDEKFGLAKSISVMPGDVVKLEVYAKYVDPAPGHWSQALTDLMWNISHSTAGVVVEGINYASSTSVFPAGFNGLLTKNTNGAPKAYLNWLVFDRDFAFITGGFKQITTLAMEAGTDIAHEPVIPADIMITRPGYVYIYLSNEEATPVEVYFDDFKVTHIKSPVIQSNDYYPYGLSFNSFKRESNLANNYLFNAGTEKEDELGLEVYSTSYRGYDPVLGRFMQVDPLADKFGNWTPYSFAFNNPLMWTDPDGASPDWQNPGFSDAVWKIIKEMVLPHLENADDRQNGWTWSPGGGGSDDGFSYNGHLVVDVVRGMGRVRISYDGVVQEYVSAWEILNSPEYAGHQNWAWLAAARSALDDQQTSLQEDFEQFLHHYFEDELRSLNKLAAEKNGRITWYIDYRYKYARRTDAGATYPMDNNKRAATIVHLNAFAEGWKLLYITVAHEMAHQRDILNGNLEQFEFDFGIEDTRIIMEYRAYLISAQIEEKLGAEYGGAAQLEYYKSQLPADYNPDFYNK